LQLFPNIFKLSSLRKRLQIYIQIIHISKLFIILFSSPIYSGSTPPFRKQ